MVRGGGSTLPDCTPRRSRFLSQVHSGSGGKCAFRRATRHGWNAYPGAAPDRDGVALTPLLEDRSMHRKRPECLAAKYAREDSNLQPRHYECLALTIELRARMVPFIISYTFGLKSPLLHGSLSLWKNAREVYELCTRKPRNSRDLKWLQIDAIMAVARGKRGFSGLL